MDSKLLFVFIIGFIGVYNVAEVESSSLSREKRQNINPLEIIVKVQEMIEKCKKPNQPPAENNTNIIQNFIEEYDLKCLFEGTVKIIQDIRRASESRTKRDTAQTILDLMKLQEAVQECKKSGVPDDASILDKYDLGCVTKAVVEFIKELAPPSNNTQRRKRAIRLGDITCFIMKALEEEPKIQEIIRAFTHRTKRQAGSEKMCEDFGHTMDSILQFIKDFAPGQA